MPETWGMLPKSQEDNSTIDEEIDSKIQDHLDDPDAHIEENQSLQSHKASEIIDHLAESIVNDKLKPAVRAYTAIVSNDDDAEFSDIQSAINYCDSIGGGNVLIKSGYYLLSSNIELARGVDLQGAGINETILDFQNGAYGIKSQDTFFLPFLQDTGATFTNGSKIVSFEVGTDLISAGIVKGQAIRKVSDYSIIGYIESVDSATQITLKVAYSDINATFDVLIQCVGLFTDDSNIVSFDSDLDLFDLGVRVGMKITDMDEETDAFYITAIGDDGTLTLDHDFIGSTYISELLIFYFGPLSNLCSDFSILNSSAISAFYVRSHNHLINIERVRCDNISAFLYCNFSSTFDSYVSKKGFVRNSYITDITGTYAFYLADYDIFDNHIDISENISYVFNCHSLVNIERNYIYLSNLLGANLIYSRAGHIHINNNKIGFISELDAHVISYEDINLTNNYITFNTNQDLDFKHARSVIIGNTIDFAGTGKLDIQSGADNNIVIGNVFNATIVNAGSNNQIANNIQS